MDMEHMDHDSSEGGPFVDTNSSMARSYWYIIASILGFTLILRIIHIIEARTRFRLAKSRAVEYPTRPQNALTQAIATGSAILREVAGPEYHIQNRWLSWLSPPSLGRCLIILVYWAVIIYMLCWESVVNDGYYYERIGYRAAWVSITQVPFVYLLASKSSIIGLLSGSSHERLNWLHRWVSRTLLVTVTIHGAFFYAEWDRAGFVDLELELMPMVKYGMGAWAILLWTFLSSLAPIRSFSYEIFVLQHLAAAAVFLWLLWVHVPQYAMYNIWFAIAAVSFDKIFMACWTAWTNISVPAKGESGSTQIIGHQAEVRTLNNDMTEVIVHDVKFKWAAGQHIYLRIPSIGPIESHPFTIANAYNNPTNPRNSIQLLIEKKSGFTKRLHTSASKAPPGGHKVVTALLTGPLGNPPVWASYETLVLISASTGITFTLPILESIVNRTRTSCVRRIDFLQIVRKRHSTNPYTHRLQAALVAAAQAGIALTVRVAVTCETCGCCGANCQCHDFSSAAVPTAGVAVAPGASSEEVEEIKDAIVIEGVSTPSSSASLEKAAAAEEEEEERAPLVDASTIMYSVSRPDIAAFIRRPVEATGGETGVAVCGGRGVVACVRNAVAGLSDERGVHKGTGAQGIALFTEHYCF